MHLRFTPPFRKECGDSFNKVSARIAGIITTYYPEIDFLKVGYSKKGGYYSIDRDVVGLSPRSSNYHIGHELTHYLQYNGHNVPRGERSCDVFTFARSPLFCEGSVHYVKVPTVFRGREPGPRARQLVHRSARRALERRAEGRRGYIKWFEEELSKEARAVAP